VGARSRQTTWTITYFTPDSGWQTIGIKTNGQNFTGIYGTAV
jgi:hypothetical protein